MNTNLLKWIAIVAMALEHAVRLLSPDPMWAVLIGRIAFPLFGGLVAYNGLFRSSDVVGYVARLSVWGVVAQLPWLFAFGGGAVLNVLFTLALGLLVVDLAGKRASGVALTLCVCACVTVVEWVWGVRVVEFGAAGVASVVAWSAWHRWRGCWWVAVCACVACANVVEVSWTALWLAGWACFGWLVWEMWRGVDAPRLPGWVWYAFYPAHLVVLLVVKGVVR